jgi:hypothetical protein
MNREPRGSILLPAFVAMLALFATATGAEAAIPGLSGPVFDLEARTGHLSIPEGSTPLFWGLAPVGGRVQYPAPTLIVDQGDTVVVNLTNFLEQPTSLVFPGQVGVIASGGSAGFLTAEAPVNGSVSYTFVADKPGTYLYQSGTRPELQVEMGLVGVIIVRPAGFDPAAPTAYGHSDSAYDHEYLFLLTEMDPRIHALVDAQGGEALDGTDYLSHYVPNFWFINGRAAPDTMAMAGVPWLPNQPYNCMPMMHPGEKLLLRVIGGGRDLHPFHHHGNHARIIARNGRLLESAPGAGADLSTEVFTIKSIPGQTADAVFEWTGAGMGWDIYGTGPLMAHNCTDGDSDGFDDTTWEYCADHGKPFPVTLPEAQDMTFGGMWGGTPFMGVAGSLPPGEGGLNPSAGFAYMWHSHSEKEMVNYDVFPGGNMTMLMVVPHGTPIAD